MRITLRNLDFKWDKSDNSSTFPNSFNRVVLKAFLLIIYISKKVVLAVCKINEQNLFLKAAQIMQHVEAVSPSLMDKIFLISSIFSHPDGHFFSNSEISPLSHAQTNCL